jgi:hypothetical protein
VSADRFAPSPVFGLEPHPADCVNCHHEDHVRLLLIVAGGAEATHVGRFCFGCPECQRRLPRGPP